ncbi:MAG: ATP-binding protein [Bacteroidales bacterium]|nr:ATP-binding protein [Bacteroidales bacterium]
MNYNNTEEKTFQDTQFNDRINTEINPFEAIERDLDWLNDLCKLIISDLLERTDQNISSKTSKELINEHLNNPPLSNTACPYDHFLKKTKIINEERIAILLAIAPYFSSIILSPLSNTNPGTNLTFPHLGGIINSNNKEFIPTIDTFRFFTTGGKIQNTLYSDHLLKRDNKLLQLNILRLWIPNGETMWNKQVIQPTEEFLAIIKGEKYEPNYNSNFPASKINTKLEWEDLILPYDTKQELSEISIWLNYHKEILSHPKLGRIIKPGFRCLFYGPPGTGKTLTASLLGKTTGLDVYRIDLSMIVSKWVGETEKNLKGIFDQAQNKNWILFFDEADSLFGKRTNTKSSNDRYANQEVAYLLQRIEDFPGLIVLATNMKDNIDEAFSRRFQSMVYFPNPDADTRYILWEKSLPSDFPLEKSIDLYEIADEYEVSGGIIINIVRYCVLMALNRGGKMIYEEDLEIGIMKELKKGGKIVG